MPSKRGSGKTQNGAAAIELALLSPFIILLLLVAAEYGWLMANSVMVVNVAASGARFLANQRGSATPYSDTGAQIRASAAYLSASKLSYSVSVGATSCSANDTCALNLNNAVKNGAVTSASVTVSYPYQPLTGLTNLPASLSATVAGRVQ